MESYVGSKHNMICMLMTEKIFLTQLMQIVFYITVSNVAGLQMEKEDMI